MNELLDIVVSGQEEVLGFLSEGGVVIWLIALLAVLTLTVIIWCLLRLSMSGVWTGGHKTEKAIRHWRAGEVDAAVQTVAHRRSIRATVAHTAFVNLSIPAYTEQHALSEVERVAKRKLAETRAGLKFLELIATIAPLLGLLGTVLGMIAAFQAMQDAGVRSDPADLAGGIWEALLTTAAGMAVAIPATMAVSWLESQIDRLRLDLEDVATRIFLPRHEPVSEVQKAA